MSALIEFLAKSQTQAVFWLVCVSFAIYFAIAVKKMSLGDDTGTKAWSIIAVSLFLIGFRVAFKVIFPLYGESYGLQILRYSLGIIGVILLYCGFKVYQSTLRAMYGVDE